MTEDYRELLIGCGHARDKRIHPPGVPPRIGWRNLTTLDLNPHCGADLQCDLGMQPPWYVYPRSDRLEFLYQSLQSRQGVHYRTDGYERQCWSLQSDYWDEIHAYEVLEHLGQQGDAQSFLAQFSEIYRLLRSGGYLCATVPSRFSPWLWGDPSHRRAIVPESLVFLDQEQYSRQIQAAPGRVTPMSDFRESLGYRADFKLVDQHDNRTSFTFILQAVKPSRYVDAVRST